MKQLFYIAAMTLASVACTDQQVASSEPAGLRQTQPPHIELRKSLSDVFINSTSFCNSALAYTPECGGQVYTFQAQLMTLDPIPVPQPNLDPTISAEEAVKLYKEFVAEHMGEPILAVFRQLYPRILLNKYGIMNSHDYTLVAFFARELIESGSYDFGTQANALTTIRTRIPTRQFDQLVQLATKNLRLYKPIHQQSFDRRLAELDNPSALFRRFPESLRKEMRAHLIERTQTDNQAFAQLEQLQRGVAN